MDKRKPIDKRGLGRFWKNAEAWITANLKALFDNDDELSRSLSQLQDDVDAIKNGGSASTPEYPEYVDVEDEYTEDEVMNVINGSETQE